MRITVVYCTHIERQPTNPIKIDRINPYIIVVDIVHIFFKQGQSCRKVMIIIVIGDVMKHNKWVLCISIKILFEIRSFPPPVILAYVWKRTQNGEAIACNHYSHSDTIASMFSVFPICICVPFSTIDWRIRWRARVFANKFKNRLHETCLYLAAVYTSLLTAIIFRSDWCNFNVIHKYTFGGEMKAAWTNTPFVLFDKFKIHLQLHPLHNYGQFIGENLSMARIERFKCLRCMGTWTNGQCNGKYATRVEVHTQNWNIY